MTNPNKLQGASLQAFTEGIGLVLSRWSALRAAVENEWAGRDTNLKAHKLAADVLAWFTQSKGIIIPFFLNFMMILIFLFSSHRNALY